MNIIWKGQSCFFLTTSQNKNSQTNIVIDPFSEDFSAKNGLKIPKSQADILIFSQNSSGAANIKNYFGEPFVIDNPGEYEIKNVYIRGIPADGSPDSKTRTIIYIIEMEEIKVCHLGKISQKELSASQLEKIGEVDVLMIPVGGDQTISAKEAFKIMSQIEPKITIPMHYQIPKLKANLDGVDKFLKTLGLESVEPQSKLSIRKKDISSDEAKIIVLNP